MKTFSIQVSTIVRGTMVKLVSVPHNDSGEHLPTQSQTGRVRPETPQINDSTAK